MVMCVCIWQIFYILVFYMQHFISPQLGNLGLYLYLYMYLFFVFFFFSIWKLMYKSLCEIYRSLAWLPPTIFTNICIYIHAFMYVEVHKYLHVQRFTCYIKYCKGGDNDKDKNKDKDDNKLWVVVNKQQICHKSTFGEKKFTSLLFTCCFFFFIFWVIVVVIFYTINRLGIKWNRSNDITWKNTIQLYSYVLIEGYFWFVCIMFNLFTMILQSLLHW